MTSKHIKITYLIPDPSSKGGMTSITKMLYRAGLFDTERAFHFSTSFKYENKFGRFYEFIFRFFSFIKHLLTYKPDVVFVMSNSYLGFYEKCFYCLIARAFGKKTILNHVGGQFDIFYNKHWMNKVLIRLSLKFPHVMLVATNFWCDYFRQLFPKLKVLNSPNPIFSNDYANTVSIGDRDMFTNLTLSRLVEEKGIFELIDVIRAVCLKEARAEFVIIGTGPMLSEINSRLKELIENKRVRVLGFVDDEVKVKEICNSDLYILLTHIDVMPISIMEAMAAKKPVISTPVGGIPDLLEDGYNGYMVEVGDTTAAIEKLIYLINHPDLVKAMGANSKKKVETEYEVEAVIRLYESVAQSLLD